MLFCVQIFIWFGGFEINVKGIIDWVGGKIDWNLDEIKKYGYYFVIFGEIKVECWKMDKFLGINKGVFYYYNDIRVINDIVVDSNKFIIFKSFFGMGINMNKGEIIQFGSVFQIFVIYVIFGGGVVGFGNVFGVNNGGFSFGGFDLGFNFGGGVVVNFGCSFDGFL